MPPSVLIVSSTRSHADPQEILRIQDTVAALLAFGCSVDLLVPRMSPLLDAALDPGARVFTVPRVPWSDVPPSRPSFRRFLAGALMFFRAVALAARREYTVLHGVNDGAMIVRMLDRVTIRRIPYVAEIRNPFNRRGFFKSPYGAPARALERGTLRHASAVILMDEDKIGCFGRHLPLARTSIIPDPHVELSPDALTVGEFNLAIEHIYRYVTRDVES